MRKILFRGKRTDNGEWETGFLVAVRGETSGEQVFIADKMTGYHTPVDPKTVGQYTGLTDRNGTKIFEGDICTIRIPNIYGDFTEYTPCVWYFERGCFCCVDDITGEGWSGDGYGYVDTASNNIELIGNIHDNPELLGG